MLNFNLTSDQLELQQKARTFALKEICEMFVCSAPMRELAKSSVLYSLTICSKSISHSCHP